MEKEENKNLFEKGEEQKSKERTASKLYRVWEALEEFDEEDKKNLRELIKKLKKQNEELSSVKGFFVDLDRAEHKIEKNKLIMKRARALLTLLNNPYGEKDLEIDIEFLKKEIQQEKINKMFGL